MLPSPESRALAPEQVMPDTNEDASAAKHVQGCLRGEQLILPVRNRVEVELAPDTAMEDIPGIVVLEPHPARPGNPQPNLPSWKVRRVVDDETNEASWQNVSDPAGRNPNEFSRTRGI
jgi:hypothetical protein